MTLLEPVAISSSEDRERRARFTHGATFTLEELSSERAPEHLASLRASEPVTWMPELGGWLVSSRELAREVLLPREDVSVESEQNMVRASLGRMMLTVDEPTHERMRGPFDAHFRPRAVRESFEGVCARVARDLLSAWSPGEVELSVAFARPYAILMAAEVLGIELGDVDAMIETYDAFAAAMEYTGDPEPLERARRAREALDVLLAKSLDGAGPGTSLSAGLVSDDLALSRAELIDQLRVIMFGSIETIQASVLNTIYLLGRDDVTRRELIERSVDVQSVVNESLRLIPPVAFVERWAKDDLEIGGVEVRRGEFIGVSVLGANHDPMVFNSPERFDVHRANAHQSLSFSFGTHHCLGFHLAKLQTNIALEQLMERLGDFTLVEVDEPEGFAFRKPHRVVVRAG